MSRVVFFLEEPSMADFLKTLLPRLFPDLAFVCVVHDGKQDLEKRLTARLRAFREPGVRFVVVRDQDREDCRQLKARLLQLCRASGRTEVLVRIACRELEAWYLGDLEAVANAYGRTELRFESRKKAFRTPDSIQKPSEWLLKLIPEFQKRSGAIRLGQSISVSRNQSRSFQVFVTGLAKLAEEPVHGAGSAGEN
ncbi:MAG: DUF4276 family protein [Deltaproteobacteria bacterium]|nr:DUF4276 family protein [Deltaproteobacteria bacterium]